MEFGKGEFKFITPKLKLKTLNSCHSVWVCEDPGADTGEETTTNLNKTRAFYDG